MKISSFEIIGSREKSVAIVEIPDELKNKQKQIAQEIMKRHKNVKTVLKKASERKGKYRIKKYRIISGEKNTEVIHKEHGCRFKLDPRKVYFSSKEGTERLRIANQVKKNEKIMLMFAGVGPYGIIISKKQPSSEIIAVEINPLAVKYMKENIKLNKIKNMTPIKADVKEKAKEYFFQCNRVIMPLPHDAEKYLQIAIKCLKNKGIIHLYFIEKEENVKKRAEKIISKINQKNKYKIRKVLPYASRTYKYCLDIKLM